MTRTATGCRSPRSGRWGRRSGSSDEFIDVGQAPHLLLDRQVGAVAGLDVLLAVVIEVIRRVQVAAVLHYLDDPLVEAVVRHRADDAAHGHGGRAGGVTVRLGDGDESVPRVVGVGVHPIIGQVPRRIVRQGVLNFLYVSQQSVISCYPQARWYVVAI